MSNGDKRDWSVQITAAIIGGFCTIIAAIIGGIFPLFDTPSPPGGSLPTTVAPVAQQIIPVYVPEQSQPTVEPSNINEPQEWINELSTSVAHLNLQIDPSTIRQPASLPLNFTCPSVAGAAWLNAPFVWYGPFLGRNGVSYSISYDATQIFIWSSLYGIQSWNDPQSIGGRNQWLTLTGTPFVICVDGAGAVFTIFTP
jgi:hypothetical protein